MVLDDAYPLTDLLSQRRCFVRCFKDLLSCDFVFSLYARHYRLCGLRELEDACVFNAVNYLNMSLTQMVEKD